MRIWLITGVALLAGQSSGFGPSWVGGKTHDGETVAADCPVAYISQNIGSKIDGAGMCVDTSVETQAKYLGLDEIRGFRDYWASAEGGGNTPTGLVRQLKSWATRKGIDEPKYLQYTGPDPVALLDLCGRTERGCAIAYGYSPRYGRAINHMVFCPHPRGPKFGAVADNNVFGGLTPEEPKRYEWMGRDELVKRMKTQADRNGRAVNADAWVFTFLEPPPPPSPKQFPTH
jgi:hypothetical protein